MKIVIIGSSTAAGKNLDEPMYGGRVGGLADAWGARLEVYLTSMRPGSSVLNLAKPGYNPFHAQPNGTVNPGTLPAVDTTRNITAALNANPDAIIVAYRNVGMITDGTVTVDQYFAALKEIASTAAAMNVPVWFANESADASSTQPQRDGVLPYKNRYDQEFGNKVIDFWSLVLNSNGTVKTNLFLSDGGHANAEGHRLMFEAVKAKDIPGNL